MQKVRLLQDIPDNWDARMGPAIGVCNDIYFLKDEPWLEVRNTSIAECKKDGVIPWCRTGCRDELRQCVELGIKMIVGPNAVFGNSGDPLANRYELESPAIYRLLMSDEVNGDMARRYVKEFGIYDTSLVQQVPYFMRPELYTDPYYFKHVYDVYFHIKTGGNKWVREPYKSITATFHGWYNFPELKYKAQHADACVHSCSYDNYGLAIHEISLLGCPLVYDKDGMKRGAIGEGMGIEVPTTNTEYQEDAKTIIAAIDLIKTMNRKKFWEASMEYQSVENCKRRYRKAIFGE